MGRRTLRQKGGIKKYKYTTQERRIEWTDKAVPYGMRILSRIPEIPWNSYVYTGPVNVEYTPDVGFGVPSQQIRKQVQGTARLPRIPYTIIGGTACELYAKTYPNIKILKYVDPTSDIDVVISNVVFTPDDDEIDGTDAMMDGELLEHFTRWLFEEVRILFQTPVFEDENFVVPVVVTTDLHAKAGNVCVIRHTDEEISRIQGLVTVCKTEQTHHFIEFLVSLGSLRGRPDSNTSVLNGLFVSSVPALFTSQLKGLENRRIGIGLDTVLETHASSHKIHNHCGRVLYLTHLIGHLIDTKKLVVYPQELLELKKYYKTGVLDTYCGSVFGGISKKVFGILFARIPRLEMLLKG